MEEARLAVCVAILLAGDEQVGFIAQFRGDAGIGNPAIHINSQPLIVARGNVYTFQNRFGIVAGQGEQVVNSYGLVELVAEHLGIIICGFQINAAEGDFDDLDVVDLEMLALVGEARSVTEIS